MHASTDVWHGLVYLEDVWYRIVEMFPLLRIEVLQLGSVLVLTLIRHVSPQVELGFGLNGYIHTNIQSTLTYSITQQPHVCTAWRNQTTKSEGTNELL